MTRQPQGQHLRLLQSTEVQGRSSLLFCSSSTPSTGAFDFDYEVRRLPRRGRGSQGCAVPALCNPLMLEFCFMMLKLGLREWKKGALPSAVQQGTLLPRHRTLPSRHDVAIAILNVQ